MTRHPIPSAALAQHTIVLGKTRSGKSSAMRLMVESALDDQRPVCIIDPKGDWWGLKSSASGKHAGYPVVIFGGEHADVPLTWAAAPHVAELVATGNRPCIIDLGGWSVGDRTRFFIGFASTLFRLSRGPRLLVIDEVHNFAPQGKVMDPDAGKMLHWANRLASEGSGKGITLLSASQRPQKVHKDFVTSNETLIAMRVIHPLDRGAIKDWIDGCPDPEKGKEVLGSLASMARGEGWAWSPEIGFGPQRIKFPKFSTYDSFAAPLDDTSTKLTGWAAVDLEEVKTKLAAVVEEAKANDPKALKAEIAELRKKLASAPAARTAPDPQAIATAEQRGEQRGYECARAAFTKTMRDGLAKLRQGLTETAKYVTNRVACEVNEVEAEWHTVLDAKPAPAAHVPLARPVPHKANGSHVPVPRPVAAPKGDGTLTPALQRVVNAIAWWRKIGREPIERARVAVVAGLSPEASTIGVYLAALVQRGLVETEPGKVRLTDAGIAIAEVPMATTREELRRVARDLLKPQEARVFDEIYSAGGEPIERKEVAERLGLSTTASTIGVYIAAVANYGIVEAAGPGQVRAAEWLFP